MTSSTSSASAYDRSTSVTQHFTTRRVTLTVPLPISAITTALDAELKADKNQPGSFPAVVRKALRTVHPGDSNSSAVRKERIKKEFESLARDHLGECDFMVFDTLRHSPWYNLYRPEGVAPVTTTRYVYGNPLIARTMIEHNFVAGLHVPTNLILIGDEKQTFIVYDVPSSLIGVENPVITFESQPESGGLESLRAAAEVLDKKVEGLLKTVIQRADVLTKAKL